MFAVPMEQIVRIHASSGTTGKPTVVGYTKDDIDALGRARGALHPRRRRPARRQGPHRLWLRPLHRRPRLPLRRRARSAARSSPCRRRQTERQVQLIRDFRPDIIAVTPSYLLAIADEFDRQGIDAARMRACASPSAAPSPGPRRCAPRSSAGWACRPSTSTASPRCMGPGVAQECAETKDGLTLWEDHFLPEVIDPETGEVLPDGAEGELVLTSLTKEAMPVIRYRTRDLTRLLPGTAADHAPHRAHQGPERRHADHPRRQRLPVADRSGARGRGARSRRTTSWKCRGRSASTSSTSSSSCGPDAAGTLAEDEHADLERRAASISSRRMIGVIVDRARRSAGHDRALAGQGEARHRPAAARMSEQIRDAPLRRAPAYPCGDLRRRMPAWSPRRRSTGAYDDGRRALRRLLAPLRRPASARCRRSRSEAPPRPRRRRCVLSAAARIARALPVRACRGASTTSSRPAARASSALEELVFARRRAVPGLVPTRGGGRRRSRARTRATRTASRSTRASSSPMCSANPRRGLASLPRHAAASPGERRACRTLRGGRQPRPRLGAAGAAAARRCTSPPPIPASSTPRTTRPSTAWRPRSTSRSSIRASEIVVLRGGRGRPPEIRRPAGLRRRHQPDASLSRQDPVRLVPAARPGLRPQALPRRRHARRAARRPAGTRHREALDRGGRTPSPSAATASCCSSSTTCSPPPTPS